MCAGIYHEQVTIGNQVTVVDLPPPGVPIEHAESSQGQCTITRDLRCALGTLHAGGQALVQVTARVAADASGALVNTAAVWNNRAELDEANDTATSTVHVTPPPPAQPVSDLVITRKVDRAVVGRGQRLRYTITVANKGPDTATGVRVTDTAALPVRVLSIHAGQGQCRAGPPLTCRLGTLRRGAHNAITITGVAIVVGTQVNTAGVMSASRDPDPSNSIASARTRIIAAPPPAPPFTG